MQAIKTRKKLTETERTKGTIETEKGRGKESKTMRTHAASACVLLYNVALNRKCLALRLKYLTLKDLEEECKYFTYDYFYSSNGLSIISKI